MDNRKKRKIVFIHPDLGIGGAERLVLDAAIALAEKGNEITFVTNHFDETHAFQELKDGQFPVRVVGDWIPRSICGLCQALCAYFRMIYLSLVYVLFISKDERPDVYFIDQIPMAVPFIKWSGGKVVYYCHHPDLLASPQGGTLKRLYRMPIDWMELKGTGLADIILVNSKYTASVFCKTFPQIRKEIRILYPTISACYQNDIENYKSAKQIDEVVPEIKIVDNQIVFLSINRYHPAKNLKLALDGLEALKNTLSSSDWQRVHLVVAGGYDPQSAVNAKYFSELVAAAEEKNLITKVTFLKSLSDSLKVDLLLSCDCLIYTPMNEHFGIVPLEAMIAGKPVIACNSGGPCETVKNEVTGYLCDPNGKSLARAMSQILNKGNALKMGQEGKERLLKYFSHSVFINEINDVIDGMCFKKLNQCDPPIQKEKKNTDVQVKDISLDKDSGLNKSEEKIVPKADDSVLLPSNFKNDSASKKSQEKKDIKNVNVDEEKKSTLNEATETSDTGKQSPVKVETQKEQVIEERKTEEQSSVKTETPNEMVTEYRKTEKQSPVKAETPKEMGTEDRKTEQQSPVKTETQKETVIEDNNTNKNEENGEAAETYNAIHEPIESKLERPRKVDRKMATATFLQNETEASNNYVEVAKETFSD